MALIAGAAPCSIGTLGSCWEYSLNYVNGGPLPAWVQENLASVMAPCRPARFSLVTPPGKRYARLLPLMAIGACGAC